VTALAVVADDSGPARHPDWAPIAERAPQLVETAWRYLDQIALSLRPATVDAADIDLRGLTQHLVAEGLNCFAAVERRHIESYKQWLATAGTRHGRAPARNTIRQRLGLVRSFFDRTIEWDWAAPDLPISRTLRLRGTRQNASTDRLRQNVRPSRRGGKHRTAPLSVIERSPK